MREPLPVQIVNQPDTNLLLELANGLIGAVVGAAAAALVAFLVVRRAQEADRTIARELAAYAAAEELTDSVIRTWRMVSRMAGRYEEEDLRKARGRA